MTVRDVYVMALEDGRRAEPGDANPYAGQSPALAKLWLRGYQSMLKQRFHEAPSQQALASARARAGQQN